MNMDISLLNELRNIRIKEIEEQNKEIKAQNEKLNKNKGIITNRADTKRNI